ncbi:MAG: hypothetical protein Fur0035_06480 [Anaerolineales bacterium]
MPYLLFVCTANLIRSPLAQAAAQKVINERGLQAQYRLESAGTWAQSGAEILPQTLAMAQKFGLPGLENHRAREINAAMLRQADQVIVMTKNQREAILAEFPWAKEKILLMSEWGGDGCYDIPDPALGQSGMEEVTRLIMTLAQAFNG